MSRVEGAMRGVQTAHQRVVGVVEEMAVPGTNYRSTWVCWLTSRAGPIALARMTFSFALLPLLSVQAWISPLPRTTTLVPFERHSAACAPSEPKAVTS